MAQSIYRVSVNIGDGNANSGNIIGSFNTNIYKSDEDAEIMRWLSPLEPNNRHQGVRNDRFDGVGDWFLETREFQEWREGEGEGDKAVLFCSGSPGVGKTYLSSLVIDTLCDQAREEGIAVACFYCDYLSQQDQTIVNIMGAILKQLFGRGGIPKYIREAFQEGKKEVGGRGLRLPGLMRILRSTIASLPQVFICIDALDECLPKHLLELLESLGDIVRESPNTRILLTGRPQVGGDVQRYLAKAIVMPISPNTGEVRNYLEMRLSKDPEPDAMNDNLREDIVRIILEKISDIFLLVVLNIDAILGEVTIRQRRKKLEEMTKGNGLSDAYKATLGRLKAQKGNKSILGMKVLMWVVYSERQLRAEELCHALGVEVGSADLDFENVPTLRTLLSSSLGLVTVEVSSSTVRLVHFTLQEHLSGDPALFDSPHSAIAEVCLTYLNFGSVKDISPTRRSAPSTTPFLEYSSYYWGDHTRRATTGDVKTLALRLLDRFDQHISTQLLLLRESHRKPWGPYFNGEGGPSGFTGLHGAAFLGIVEILGAILPMKEWDVNATDSNGSTALIWAAFRGQEDAVKRLLERPDANPNTQDAKYGRTPLSWAAGNGQEGVVKVLLERADVNPSQADTQYGQTPLSRAAQFGHGGVVKMLLERADVNPDHVDTDYGRTPLSWAAWEGHEEVVKMLLEREDVNSDKPDIQYGRTPLSWAAGNGQEAVVKILSERTDINPNRVDTRFARTPLSFAARFGHEGVVKALLVRGDINPNTPDAKYGRTPLWWAARWKHEGVVKVLLEREEVNPNTADTKYGRTPLSWAAVCGQEGVVKLLLEREGVNPDQADTDGRTPFSWAVASGQEGVVQMLLERADVNPGDADTNGQTPLWWAAKFGREGLVKILLKRGDVNPNTADSKYCRTPLWRAARYGDEGVVKVLLERADVNPDHADTKYGRTPISWAAEFGHEGVVRMLLKRADVNPNRADNQYGRTPLSWAAGKGHERIVNMLMERPDVNPGLADTQCGLGPLSRAAMRGHEEVLKMLLERADVNPDQADTNGRTPLSWAAGNGQEGVVQILLERSDVNPDHVDTTGRTPLSLAAKFGREGVIKMLLEREGVNPNTADTKYGRTPLWWAARYEYEGVVKVLLQRDRVNPNTTDTKYGRTPLSWAAGWGNVRIAKLLLERKDVHTATPDNKNQTPLWWALSEGHDEVARALQESENSGSGTTGPGGNASLPPPAGREDKSAAEIRFQAHDPNTDITNPLSADLGDQDGMPDINGSVPTSADNDVPAEPSTPLQPPSIYPLGSPHSPNKIDTHPNTRPTLSIAVDRYIIIASFVCLLAVLVYTLSSSPDLFSFYK